MASSSTSISTFSQSQSSPSSSSPSVVASTSSAAISVASITTHVVFATADVTITSSCSTSTTPSSGSLTNPAATSSAYSAAWGDAQSSFDGPPHGRPTGSADVFPHGPPASLPSHGTPPYNPHQPAPSSPGAASPSGTLNNEAQVGDSYWGTLDQPTYGSWLNGNGGPTYDTAPWGNKTTKNADSSVVGETPVTNVTRYYNMTVTRERISADGVLRDVLLVNNQFPGPIIEANWGDWIQVTVNNQIQSPGEGTSMHWHGMLQRETPWADGVPSIGQCPIAPGHSLTYTYRADMYGTTWYHSHYSAQMAGGIAGPVIVHGPTQSDYDVDVGPVMLSDWYHIPYFAIVADAVGTNYSVIPPTSDSVIINGRGRFNCSNPSYSSDSNWLALNWNSDIKWTCVDNAPRSQFRFQSGKVHRLRLINHGANGVQKFSIDGHKLTIIATDLVPTVPYTVDQVTLGVGQRTDVLVKATNNPQGSVWMRAELPGGEPCGGSDSPLALAPIYYENADTSKDPTTTSSLPETACVNDNLVNTVPEYAIVPGANAWTQDLSLTLDLNSTGHFEFRINEIAYRADYNYPVLPQVAAGNLTTEREWNVYNFGQNTSIILNITNNMPLTHPFHMHGHNFYVLNFGDNTTHQPTALSKRAGPTFENGAVWDGSVINPSNPMRRDTLLVPSYGFAAIQIDLTNPGLWPFHCHIAWHLSAGQIMNILYRPEDMEAIPKDFVADTCADWDYYSARNGVSQIDSGG